MQKEAERVSVLTDYFEGEGEGQGQGRRKGEGQIHRGRRRKEHRLMNFADSAAERQARDCVKVRESALGDKETHSQSVEGEEEEHTRLMLSE